LISVCAEFGVETKRYCERSGVWVRDSKGDRKIAAIGLRVAKGVTMHGFALNVNPDLSAYSKIIPCGITDAKVTSLAFELGQKIDIQEVIPVLKNHLCPMLERVSK
jgi:lipoyl(octanoyl) transferase